MNIENEKEEVIPSVKDYEEQESNLQSLLCSKMVEFLGFRVAARGPSNKERSQMPPWVHEIYMCYHETGASEEDRRQ